MFQLCCLRDLLPEVLLCGAAEGLPFSRMDSERFRQQLGRLLHRPGVGIQESEGSYRFLPASAGVTQQQPWHGMAVGGVGG